MASATLRQSPAGRLTLSQAFLVPSPNAQWDASAFRTLVNCFAYVDPYEREMFRVDAGKIPDVEFYATLYWRIVASAALDRGKGRCTLCLHPELLVARSSAIAIRGAEHSNPDMVETLCPLCILERDNQATEEQRSIIEHRRKQAWMKRNLTGNDR